MDRASSRHSRHLDDEMADETRELTRDGPGGERTGTWRDPEPSGDGQPRAAMVPESDAGQKGSAPSGMTVTERDERSQIGRFLRRSVFPADRDQLIAEARGLRAPDEVIIRLFRLPPDQQFVNVADVWAALSHRSEEELERRF